MKTVDLLKSALNDRDLSETVEVAIAFAIEDLERSATLRARLEALAEKWSKERIMLRDGGLYNEAANLSKRLDQLREVLEKEV